MHLRPLTAEALQAIPHPRNIDEPSNYLSHVFLLETMATATRNLEKFGYCVIPDVFSREETKHLYQRIWHEFIEKAWPNCKMDDCSNWKEAFPMHNPLGILLGPASQTQVMWDIRQDPRISNIFAQIWNTQDLIVSMDGLSLMCPSEIREGNCTPWPHVDQGTLRRHDNSAHNNNPPIDFESESSLKSKPYTIQGQFLFKDSSEGDGGFYCIPKSHLRFSEFAPELEVINLLDISPSEKASLRQHYLNGFFGIGTNDSIYSMKHITAPRGSLILWDSRTIHWNQHPDVNRPYRDNPRTRMVGLLCYVPKSRLTEEGLALRMKAFELGIATGHNPANPQLKYNHIWQEFEHYREDPNYIRQKINLTLLGQSLLGNTNGEQ